MNEFYVLVLEDGLDNAGVLLGGPGGVTAAEIFNTLGVETPSKYEADLLDEDEDDSDLDGPTTADRVDAYRIHHALVSEEIGAWLQRVTQDGVHAAVLRFPIAFDRMPEKCEPTVTLVVSSYPLEAHALAVEERRSVQVEYGAAVSKVRDKPRAKRKKEGKTARAERNRSSPGA